MRWPLSDWRHIAHENNGAINLFEDFYGEIRTPLEVLAAVIQLQLSVLEGFVRFVDFFSLVYLRNRDLQGTTNEVPRNLSRQVELPRPKYLHFRSPTLLGSLNL